MRQPEIARLLPLAAALLLTVPVLQAARNLLLAGAFLVEFLSDGALAPLTRLTMVPLRQGLVVGGTAMDRHSAPRLSAGVPLVVVHGFTPEGKDDPRAQRAAGLLARAGFEVTLPTIPGLTRGRLRPEDVEPVVTAVVEAGAGPVHLMGVSVGAGPALLAAADPRVKDRISTVVSLGGYASARELLRFFLSGEYAYGTVRGRVEHDPEMVRIFLRANADLLDDATWRALIARDPLATSRFLDRPPADVGRLLDTLSPERVVRDIPARLVLVHGRADRAVPYTESLRLAAARPERTRVALVGAVEHVEGRGGPLDQGRLGDFLELWGIVYALLAGR